MTPGAPSDNLKKADILIEINISNSAIELNTYTYTLQIAGLTEELRKVHLIPDLTHASLISIKQICRGECKVVFRNNSFDV